MPRCCDLCGYEVDAKLCHRCRAELKAGLDAALEQAGPDEIRELSTAISKARTLRHIRFSPHVIASTG